MSNFDIINSRGIPLSRLIFYLLSLLLELYIQLRQFVKLSDNSIFSSHVRTERSSMEITVCGTVAYVELSEYGWVGVVHSIGSFQAATLADLIDLIKLVLSKF